MSPRKGRVYESKRRRRRVPWKLDFPFCQCTIIIVSVPKKEKRKKSVPKDWITAAPLTWAPFRWESKVPVGCLWVLSHVSSGPKGCTFPFGVGGCENACRSFLSSLLCCVHGELGSVHVCLHSTREGGDTVCVSVCDRPRGDRRIHVF